MKTIEFTNAIEFLEHFHPYKESWKNGKSIFRGHQNSSWELLPKLFRTPAAESYLAKSIERLAEMFPYLLGSRSDMITFSNLQHDKGVKLMRVSDLERYLLHLFVRETNRHGFEVRGSEQLLNIDRVFSTDARQTFFLPHGEAELTIDQFKLPRLAQPLQLTGLAQHHGLPTRLLDFTESPYAALFFASEETDNEANEEICVYSTWLDYYRQDVYKSSNYQLANFSRISGLYGYLRMPNSHNSYLSKQGGVFLYPIFPYDFHFKEERYPNLDDHARIFSFDESTRGYSVQKHTLPGSQKPALRDALTKMGYTKAYFMPTLDNVVKDIESILERGSSFSI